MHREGHVGAVMLAYAPVGLLALALGIGDLSVVGFAVSVALAMAPDLDLRVPYSPTAGRHTAPGSRC